MLSQFFFLLSSDGHYSSLFKVSMEVFAGKLTSTGPESIWSSTDLRPMTTQRRRGRYADVSSPGHRHVDLLHSNRATDARRNPLPDKSGIGQFIFCLYSGQSAQTPPQTPERTNSTLSFELCVLSHVLLASARTPLKVCSTFGAFSQRFPHQVQTTGASAARATLRMRGDRYL